MQFTYEAKDTTGHTITGSLEAESERVAANRVREMGYYPMRFVPAQGTISRTPISSEAAAESLPEHARASVRPAAVTNAFQRSIVYPLFTGITLKDLALYYRQMGAMLGAGLPLQRTLTTLEEQCPAGLLRSAVRSMAAHVLAGGELSEAMRAFPYIFSELQVEFVACGERTGGIAPMMNRLADYLEQDYQLRQIISKETLYSKMVFLAVIFLPNLVLIWLSGVKAYLDETLVPLLFLLAGGLGIFIAFRYALQSAAFRFVFDTFKSYVPYFGKTVRMMAIGKFSRALAALYSAGVQLPTGIEIAARVSGNQYLSTLIMRAVTALKAGEGLADSFRASGVFPLMFISMLSTGEKTGQVDDMLHKVADYFEAEGTMRLRQSIQVVNQIIYLILAFLVLLVCIKFYTGYGMQLQSYM